MDKIFGHFLSRNDNDMKRLAYASWFIAQIPIEEFSGDEKLFWKFIEYCSKLNVPMKRKYLDIWLNTELRSVLHETNARVSGTETLNINEPVAFETLVQTVTQVLGDDYTVLETEDNDIEDFKVEYADFITKRRNQRLTEALSETYNVLNDTDNTLVATDYALDTISKINDIYDVSKLEELNTQDAKDSATATMEFVSDSGLPAIDKDSGGIFTKQLVGIEAQPATGKTRFVLGTYVYRAITLYHKNVLFINLEQTHEEIEAMLVAAHVFHLFDIQLNDLMILRNNVPDEFKSQVEAASFDLFRSGKYGKIVCEDTELYAESFITTLTNKDRLKGPFDLICIDYMGLIESKPEQYKKELTEAEIIKVCFRRFKRYLRKTNKAGIAISQFNREGIQAGKADKEITADMAQGGLAVYRNTDYNIAISMTDTMKAQHVRRFSQPKVRSSAGFGTFIADVRLGFCYFKQRAAQKV